MKITTVLIATITAVQLAIAVELPHEFRTKDGFTIYFPENWVEIPSDVLNQYSETVHRLAPQASKQTYDYGYQHQPFDTWMSYPYVLIQVKRTGRLPESELKKYKRIEEGFRKGMSGIENKMSGLVSQAQQGKPIYDSPHHILWMTMSMNVQNVGPVSALLALKLTEFGIVQVMMYATQNTFDTYEPVFRKIATNMTLTREVQYKPQIADSFPIIGGINTGKVVTAALQGALIGGIIGLIAWIVKRIKKVS